MKLTIPPSDSWQMSSSADRYEYTWDFDLNEDFLDGRVCLEFGGLGPNVDVLLNDVEIDTDKGAPVGRLKVGDRVHAGANGLTVRSDTELDSEALGRVRVVSYDKVSISSIDIEPDIADRTASVWITIGVENHTCEDQHVLASVVVAQGECREKIEIPGSITPFGGEVESVIRITDPEMWEPNEAGERPMFDCLIGVQVEGAVMDVALARFDVA